MASPTPTGTHDRPRGLVGPFSGPQLLAAAVAVLLVAGALKALTTPIGAAAPAVPTPGSSFVAFGLPQVGLQPGDHAPELAGTFGGQPVVLTDLAGRPIRLDSLRGHPVWINFFATWCPPCQSETPTIEEVYEAHRAQGLVVIGVSVQESSIADVRAYAKTYGLQYTIGFDGTSAVYRAYQIYGLPTQVFIDRQGIVRQVWNGPLSLSQAEQMLAPLLAAPPGASVGSGGSAASAASPAAAPTAGR
jgi:cytochrome c biogenesis protein CcmG/thiol:disulfide interchange protein DsbE